MANGLCSITALSRYEDGLRIPDKFLLTYLLQRLGCDSNQYEMIINNDEYTLSQLQATITSSIENKKYDDALNAISDYKKLKSSKSPKIHEQFCLYSHGLIMKNMGNHEQAIAFF